MARNPTGTPAQRTLLDAVNRHPLTAQHLNDSGGELFTVRQVQRLGEDHLAPRPRDGDPITDDLVAHCAALLTARRPGRGLSDDLLPLSLAVAGRPMLPDYVKVGAVRHLDDLANRSAMVVADFNTDTDPVLTIGEQRSASIRNLPGVPLNRKRPSECQLLINKFHEAGLDKIDDEGVLTHSRFLDVTHDVIGTLTNGGRFSDPRLIAETFQLLTGINIDPSAYELSFPSISEIRDWVRDRPWDNRVTGFIPTVIAFRGMVMPGSPTTINTETLVHELRMSVMFLIMRDRFSLAHPTGDRLLDHPT